MSLRIVHFSVTPLAGGPYRLVRLLRKHTDFDVRLVDLERWGIYPHDVVYKEAPEEAISLAKEADIIHFHNYLNYDSTDFWPINFRELLKNGKSIIRQFRSEPKLVARHMGISVSQLLNSEIPSIVIAQYPERFYPKALVVRNAIAINDPEYSPNVQNKNISSNDLIFSPTKSISAWQDRWNTKGMPETVRMLEQVSRLTGSSYKVVSGLPLHEVLLEKRKSRIVLDDLVTGSYHMSGIEAMCLGKAVLSYLDPRIEQVLREVTTSDTNPFINVRLEDAKSVLLYLLKNLDEVAEIGKESRTWIENNWSETLAVQDYVKAYEKLLEDPNLVTRQASLQLSTSKGIFDCSVLPNLVYSSRSENAESSNKLASHKPVKPLSYFKSKIKIVWRKIKKLSNGSLLKIVPKTFYRKL